VTSSSTLGHVCHHDLMNCRRRVVDFRCRASHHGHGVRSLLLQQRLSWPHALEVVASDQEVASGSLSSSIRQARGRVSWDCLRCCQAFLNTVAFFSRSTMLEMPCVLLMTHWYQCACVHSTNCETLALGVGWHAAPVGYACSALA
jgi:hypothetical protein